MYDNVGKKIMTLAKVLGWVFLIAGIITAIVFMSFGWKFFIVITPLIGGAILYILTWFLYGFGQLVDDVSAMRYAAKEADRDTVSEELPEL